MEEVKQIDSSGVIVFVIAGIAVLALLFGFIIHFVFTFRSKQRAYTLLDEQKQHIAAQKALLESTLTELKATQAQLIQSAKMASLGELTAGIAHEIQNPLNFINNFSEVSDELMDELKEEINNGNTDEARRLAEETKANLNKIVQHGKRADAIVKNMLQHSHKSNGVKELVDLNAIVQEYLLLSFHSQRAKDKNFNVTLHTDYDKTLGKVPIVPSDVGRVVLNIFTNAFYSMAKKKEMNPEAYDPILRVSTHKNNNKVVVVIRDNGLGIADKLLDKIYHPFFTTKPTGEGTGLGLSLSYDIIKAHGGELKVASKEGNYAEFVLTIPG